MKKWKRGSRYGTYRTEVVDMSSGRVIAAVWTHEPVGRDKVESWPEGEANLNLIIAVPDWLEALESIAELAEFTPSASPWETLRMISERARAAIAKVEGTHE